MASIMQITSAAFLLYDFSRFDRLVPGFDYTWSVIETSEIYVWQVFKCNVLLTSIEWDYWQLLSHGMFMSTVNIFIGDGNGRFRISVM